MQTWLVFANFGFILVNVINTLLYMPNYYFTVFLIFMYSEISSIVCANNFVVSVIL